MSQTDMPEYVRYWIDTARYWRMKDGPQDTWRDAMLWLANQDSPPNTHAPDAETMAELRARLDALPRPLHIEGYLQLWGFPHSPTAPVSDSCYTVSGFEEMRLLLDYWREENAT
jgi:hypothetical protein